jgi:hypothetical protein
LLGPAGLAQKIEKPSDPETKVPKPPSPQVNMEIVKPFVKDTFNGRNLYLKTFNEKEYFVNSSNECWDVNKRRDKAGKYLGVFNNDTNIIDSNRAFIIKTFMDISMQSEPLEVDYNLVKRDINGVNYYINDNEEGDLTKWCWKVCKNGRPGACVGLYNGTIVENKKWKRPSW